MLNTILLLKHSAWVLNNGALSEDVDMSIKFTSKKYGDNLSNQLTRETSFFLNPQNTKHRQYEALRAFFVDNTPGRTVAEKFGYSYGAFRLLCHQFKNDPNKNFFIQTKPGPRYGTKRDSIKDEIVKLRKQNYSVNDIAMILKEEKKVKISSVWIWNILHEEGFARLPRRKDDERPQFEKADQADYADIRQFDLSPDTFFHTKLGGLFVALKIVSDLRVHKIPNELNWYGSKMIPTENAFISCLLLKLIGMERKSHVMDVVFDKGAALAAGLNVVPKTAYLSEYANRITHEDNVTFMNKWFPLLRKHFDVFGESFNLDFQSLPYYGDQPVVQKHYVSMRSRSQKAILVFFAQDENSKIFCYSNADIRKGEEADEVFRFIDFWKKHSGKNPPHLVFDSKLTTYANLSRLNQMGITFITLRRKSKKLLQKIAALSSSAWRPIELTNVQRKYRTPKIVDQNVSIKDYDGTIRQIFVKDFGHDLPTVIMTNEKKKSVSTIITRYAKRMLIENSIAQNVDFFNTTALSSAVAIKIDFDLLLTMVAQAVYRILADKLRGYECAAPRTIFRKFIDTPANIIVGSKEIEVRLHKRADNPILLKSGLLYKPFSLPWILTSQKFVVTTR